MRAVTSSGWLIIATCEQSIPTVVDPARRSIARSAAGGMTRSEDATRFQDGSVFHAGGPDGSPRVASAAVRRAFADAFGVTPREWRVAG
ncbi:hypothetical protein [uncultured Cellulomonas sp.]|uniref:hypothetical protein n=1 Tax=uncultured Cellulomonas sp. TaxID=189682 RepID=UPI0028E9B52B|nr:hypothetical protein [uncultured Cellulomonas sp.]